MKLRKLLNEGTWAIPDINEIDEKYKECITDLNKLSEKYYNIWGDDIFHDIIIKAKDRIKQLYKHAKK